MPNRSVPYLHHPAHALQQGLPSRASGSVPLRVLVSAPAFPLRVVASGIASAPPRLLKCVTACHASRTDRLEMDLPPSALHCPPSQPYRAPVVVLLPSRWCVMLRWSCCDGHAAAIVLLSSCVRRPPCALQGKRHRLGAAVGPGAGAGLGAHVVLA